MATAKKLPSGNYRVRIYDKTAQKYKSFTATTKREAERMASDYLAGLIGDTNDSPTFENAASHYINDKSKVLSPTTIDGYNKILRNNMNRLKDLKLSEINIRLVQDWINELTINKSPKTVHNVYGFFTAVLSYNDVNLKLSKIKLPAKTRHFKRLPTADVVLKTFKDTDIEIPVLLAVWCGMRISEILGIKNSDINENILTINRVVVHVKNKAVIKECAKTYESNRQIRLPKPILDLINKSIADDNSFIVSQSYKTIYRHFTKTMEAQGYDITFHDLRHINASVMAALNVPDLYAMQRGGWSNTTTLKQVYQQTFDNERKRVDDIIDSYFNNIYDTEYDTKLKYQSKNVV